MRHKRWWWLLILTAGLLMSLAACGGGETPTPEPTEAVTEGEATVAATEEDSEVVPIARMETVTVAPGDPVRIGFAAGLSGEGIEPYGVDELRGVEIAMADRPTVTIESEEWGGEIDPQDSLCSAEGGQTVANRFASDETIVAVVGHMCSESCAPARTIYEAAGLTMVSPSCTAADLTEGSSLAFNRTVSTDAVQGPVAADFMYNTLDIRRIATIQDDSSYAEGLVAATTGAFEALDGEVVAAQAINVGETDFRAVLEDIAAAEPELIYFVGFPAEGARLIEQRFDAGLEDIPFMSADGLQTPETIALAGEAAEGVYASAPMPITSEAFDAFLATYEEVYGEAPIAPYHGQAYDAYNLILNAIEAVATLDDDGNLVIDRAALAEAIRTTENYPGLTGTLTCDEFGECGGAVIEIYVVENGEFVPVSDQPG